MSRTAKLDERYGKYQNHQTEQHKEQRQIPPPLPLLTNGGFDTGFNSGFDSGFDCGFDRLALLGRIRLFFHGRIIMIPLPRQKRILKKNNSSLLRLAPKNCYKKPWLSPRR